MKEEISTIQIGSILWSLMLSAFIGIIPYIVFYLLKNDSWLALLLSFIIGFLVLALYLYIWNKLPEKNIFEKINYALGKKIGGIINVTYVIANIFVTCIYFYSMINFITSQYLVKTPNTFVIIVFIIPIIYLIIQKLQVISRTLFVFWITSTALFILTFIGLIFQLDFSKLLPVAQNGIMNIGKTSLITLPYTHFIIFLLMSIPKNSIIDKEKLKKRSVIFYSLASLTILSGCVIIITSLGGELAQIYQYSEFQVLKRVTLIGFVERIESTLSIRWILYMFTTCIMTLYFTKVFFKTSFKTKEKSNNILIGIVTIILLFISEYLFPNNTLANEIIINVIPGILYILYLLIPLIIVICIGIKEQTKIKNQPKINHQ